MGAATSKGRDKAKNSTQSPPCNLPPLKKGEKLRAVVVLCVDDIQNPKRCLILKRGSTAPWAPGRWSLPGGLIDGGEDPATAAIRELKEETDLEATNVRLLGAPYCVGNGYGMQAVLCGCVSASPLGKSSSFPGGLPVSTELGFPENDDAKWCAQEAIESYDQAVASNKLLIAEALRN